MKTIRFAILSVLMTALLSVPVWAQTTVNSTTLNGAITQTQTSITLTSISNISVGDRLFIDWELLFVLQCGTSSTVGAGCTSTTVRVQRGVGDGAGGRAAPHATLAPVWTGPGQRFQVSSPPLGTCVRATVEFLPWIDVTTGNIWTCDKRVPASTILKWYGANVAVLAYNSTIDLGVG